MTRRHVAALERIFKQCRGMTIRDVDFDLVVSMPEDGFAAIMYQAARNLDAKRVRRRPAQSTEDDIPSTGLTTI